MLTVTSEDVCWKAYETSSSIAFVISDVCNAVCVLFLVMDKTRQDNALFGILYSPMYIDFIQII